MTNRRTLSLLVSPPWAWVVRNAITKVKSTSANTKVKSTSANTKVKKATSANTPSNPSFQRIESRDVINMASLFF